MAVISAADFIKYHPEFAKTGQTIVAQAIADAEVFCNAAVYGSAHAMAVRYKACMLLASGKYGQVEKVNVKDSEYAERFEEVSRLVPRRFLVV